MSASELPPSSSLPPYLLTDLGFSIAMFVFAVVGMRFTVQNCFGVDLFNFRTLPARIAGGVVGAITLFSIYRLFSDPRRVQRLGQKLVGRKYAREQVERQLQSSADAQREATQIGQAFRADPMSSNMVGRGIAI